MGERSFAGIPFADVVAPIAAIRLPIVHALAVTFHNRAVMRHTLGLTQRRRTLSV